MQGFVQDTVAPLTRSVGEAWEDGSFEVFEEHLFTELTKRLLRQAIANLPGGLRAPRVLLTSVPEEPHVIGLLMAESLFTLEGAECIPLGTQMPLLGLLQQLRMVLPTETSLWAGGGGVTRLAKMEGVLLLNSLDEALTAITTWRHQHALAAQHD